MSAIAQAAGVSTKTVYVILETKSGVLTALWHLLLRGDAGDAPVAQRAWYREVLEEPDPERKLRLNARNARRVKVRAGALMGVIRSAAELDPDIGALWERIQTEFHDNQHVILQTLDDSGALRPGLGVDEAADIVWALNHPDVWLLLVGRRGWTADHFEQWFADTIVAQLLPPRGR
jgi:AcrR family transcriptional regulator